VTSLFKRCEDASFVELAPEFCFVAWESLETNKGHLVLDLVVLALTDVLRVFCSEKIDQSNTRVEGTQAETLIELLLYQFDLDDFDGSLVVHISHMKVFFLLEVWTWNNCPDSCEVKTLQPDRCHLSHIHFEGELVEVCAFFVDFDPLILTNVGEDLIFCLETELVIMLAAGLGAVDVMRLLVGLFFVEVLVRVIEDSESILATALEVSLLVICDADDLLLCSDRLNHV